MKLYVVRATTVNGFTTAWIFTNHLVAIKKRDAIRKSIIRWRGKYRSVHLNVITEGKAFFAG